MWSGGELCREEAQKAQKRQGATRSGLTTKNAKIAKKKHRHFFSLRSLRSLRLKYWVAYVAGSVIS
jgi:hypothetical protein